MRFLLALAVLCSPVFHCHAQSSSDTCSTDWVVATALLNGINQVNYTPVETFTFEASTTDTLSTLLVNMTATGGSTSNWASDLLVAITDPAGRTAEWGGYQGATIDTLHFLAGAWPASWGADINGQAEWTAEVDVSAANLRGTGTWSVQLANGWSTSTTAVSYNVTMTLPDVCEEVIGCSDDNACNYESDFTIAANNECICGDCVVDTLELPFFHDFEDGIDPLGNASCQPLVEVNNGRVTMGTGFISAESTQWDWHAIHANESGNLMLHFTLGIANPQGYSCSGGACFNENFINLHLNGQSVFFSEISQIEWQSGGTEEGSIPVDIVIPVDAGLQTFQWMASSRRRQWFLDDIDISFQPDFGCTNPLYAEYDPNAISEDGSCATLNALEYVPSYGLVAWYPMDGNAQDFSGLDNNGLMSGPGPTLDRFGNAGSALAFDGSDDFLLIPHDSSLAITGDITLSAWYNSDGPTGNYQTFLTKRDGNGNWPYSLGTSHYFGPGGCPEEVGKFVTGRRSNEGGNYELIFSQETAPMSTWTHIVMVVASDTVKYYQNGTLLSFACFGDAFTLPAVDTGAPLTIGACACGLDEFMNGRLDDVGIWNRALTPQEVQNLFIASQEGPFEYAPTPASGLMTAQVALEGAPASTDDWIGAFTANGTCVGATQPVIDGALSRFTLSLHGDDPVTTDSIEGLLPGDSFYLQLYDTSADTTYTWNAGFGDTAVTGWMDMAGALIPALNTPDFLYDFRTPVPGCIDESACNYSEEANLDDGSCNYDVPCACNTLWSVATAPLSGSSFETFTLEAGSQGSLGIVDIEMTTVGGNASTWAVDLLMAIVDPNGNGVEWGGYDILSYGLGFATGPSWPAEWDTTASLSPVWTASIDLSPYNLQGGGTWTLYLLNGYLSASADVQFNVDLSIENLCGPQEGCTDSNACNFDPEANIDDGSCILPPVWYADVDGDGLGDANSTTLACIQPNGYLSVAGDLCDDPSACNFNAGQYANETCQYPGFCDTCENGVVLSGDSDGDGICDADDSCSDLTACNYDGALYANEACVVLGPCDSCNGGAVVIGDTDGDGICDGSDLCSDLAACNYNGSEYLNAPCEVPGFCDACSNGVLISGDDTDADGICDVDDNCTDPNAFNYLDASNAPCLYFGCTNPTADNYDPEADLCPTSSECCIWLGCTDSSSPACNYDPIANTDDGSCDYASCAGCTEAAACNYDPDATLSDGSCDYSCLGCTNPCSGNYDASATVDDGSCQPVLGCMDATACNYDSCADLDFGCAYLDACGICGGPGAIYACGCEELPTGECDCDGNVEDACGVCGGTGTDVDADGVCDDLDACTDLTACNYSDPSGSACDYSACAGCGLADACNYDPGADIVDNGLCLYPIDLCAGSAPSDCTAPDFSGFDCNCTCLNDTDGDGVCDGDEWPGCQDVAACNYESCATDDDGTCLYEDVVGDCGGDCTADADEDGICDSEDDCLGEEDICGVCNGPGAILQCGCTNILESDCDCDGNQLDALGVCGGTCVSDANANGICDDLEATLCGPGSFYSPELGQCLGLDGTCPTDLDGNGSTGSADLLILLSNYNLFCIE
jgi:hypothetical protein